MAPSGHLIRMRRVPRSAIIGQSHEIGGSDVGRDGLIWPHCDGLNWPHLRPTGGRLFDAHGARAGGGGRNGIRMETFEQIRRDRDREGLSIRALAERHGVHRRAVRQALASPLPPAQEQAGGPSGAEAWGLSGADRLAGLRPIGTRRASSATPRSGSGSGCVRSTARDGLRAHGPRIRARASAERG